jgi:uncharacterized membrane protein YedE/YeeE
VKLVTALVAGILFATGLMISDMTSPGRIIAFLSLEDMTLLFVMVSAIGIYGPIAYLARKRSAPLFARRFHWPEPGVIDAPLVGGAVIFGVGWGLSGFCPGPALVTAGTGRLDTLIFIAAMIAGIAVTRVIHRRQA